MTGHGVFFFCLAYSTLKMEATCSSETSVDFQRLLGIISQEIELFITTTVRTTNPTGNSHGPKFYPYVHKTSHWVPILTVESTARFRTVFLRHISVLTSIHAYTAQCFFNSAFSTRNFTCAIYRIYVAFLAHLNLEIRRFRLQHKWRVKGVNNMQTWEIFSVYCWGLWHWLFEMILNLCK
jgi:hypothetical protein